VADEQNKQVRSAFEAEKRNLVNISENDKKAIARRRGIINRGYDRAQKYRISEAAS